MKNQTIRRVGVDCLSVALLAVMATWGLPAMAERKADSIEPIIISDDILEQTHQVESFVPSRSGGSDDTGGSSGGAGGNSDGGGSSTTAGGGDDGGTTTAGSGGGHGNDKNRSGLGDGTNPGQGDGRDNSPNEGTDNLNQARRGKAD